MPWYQKIIKYSIYAIVGITFIGSILDSFSNSKDIITPGLAFWISITLIGIFFLVYFVLKSYPLKWQVEGKKVIHITSLNSMIIAPFIGIIILLWITVLYKHTKGHDKVVPSRTINLINSTNDTLTFYKSGSFGLHDFSPDGFYGVPPINGRIKFSCVNEDCYKNVIIVLLPKDTIGLIVAMKNRTKYYHYFDDEEMLIGYKIEAVNEKFYFSNYFQFNAENYRQQENWIVDIAD
jgi:hypothetical protein